MKYTLALTLLAAADAALPAHPPPLAGVQQAGFEVPATCAFLYGDPHILTWDHQHADCMSDGDFLMAKSSDSDFEIQSRFYEASEEMQEMHFREKGWRVGTGTKAIVINTGVPGEPVIEIDAEVPKTNSEGKTWDSQGDFVGCQLKYYVDGKRVYLDNVDEIGDNVIFERTKAVEKNIWGDNMVTNHYRNFYFKESGVFLQVTKKYWDRFGCFMNAKICVPESVTKQNLYGLLGNANGSKGDDFETKFGETLSTNINKKNYCEENWCVKDDAESMFFEPTILDGCQQDHREELEEAVRNASDEIKEKCEDDLDCIEDAIITGDIDFGIRTLEEKKKALDNEVVGGTVDEDDDEEGICVTAEGSPVNCDSYDYEFVCEAVDYDFGLRMEGCDGDADGAFQGLFLTDSKPTCSVENYDLGTFDIDCSADGKDATITPAVDTVVKVSGSTKGMLYTGLKAGQTYTLTSAKGDKKEAIENIEFCFKCPKSIVDNEIVACAADVQTCPGDIALKRNPSDNCNFPACPPVPEVKTVAPCDAMREHTKCGYNNAARTFKKSGQTLEECQKACADDDACLFYSHQEVGPHAGACMGCKGDSDAQTDYHEDFNFYPKECLHTKTEKEIVEETEGVPADYGDCAEMYEDHKCPWQHEDRTHRIEDLTIDECYQACIDDPECMHWSYSREGDANGNFANVCMGCNATVNKHVHIGFNLYSMCPEARQPKEPEPEVKPAPPKTPGSGSGDPHFKTWTGDKYDYHGECDLVLLDHPSFKNGLGLKVHIRTTRVKYFSYIESVAVQIGDEVLEFDNDVDNFLINGEKVGENQKHHKTMLSGFVVRRDAKAISIRLYDHGTESRHNNVIAKIDLHTRKNGFPAVIVDGGHTDVFKGSLGLLGDWATGEKVGRDGKTVFEVDPENAEDFALEWQVRDNEPTLFKEARFPQFPATCTPPVKMNKGRLGMDKAKKEAEEACAHWQYDKEDCIFDVIATRDVLVAEEGHIVQME